MKKKILFPIGSFYPAQTGGPNNTVYWLSKYLVLNNFEIYVVTTSEGLNKKHKIDFNRWQIKDNINVIYYKTISHLLPIRMLIGTYSKLKEVGLVHLTSIFYFPSLIIFLFCFIKKKKVIWSPRGELDELALQYNKYLKILYLSFIRIFSKHIIFHVTSEQEKSFLLKRFTRANYVIIPNYIELPQKVECETKRQLLYIGRISPKKGIENLIKALCLSEKFLRSDFIMLIVGDYEKSEKWYYKRLLELIKKKEPVDKIKITKSVTGIEKQMIYAESYFSILPSHTENFGNVVIESLAQGTPVIASKGTPWKILEENNSGFWAENDPLSLKAVIEKVISLPLSDYKNMRKASFEFVKREFDIEGKISDWVTAYNKII